MFKITAVFIFFVFITAGLVTHSWGDEPLAPMVPVRADLAGIFGKTQIEIDKMVEDVKQGIPTKSIVGVPVPGDTNLLGGGSLGEIHFTVLVTTKTEKEIYAYYISRLAEMSGWHWSQEFQLFYKADDQPTIEELESFNIPVIETEPLFQDDEILLMVDEDYRSRLQTLIQITYFPQ